MFVDASALVAIIVRENGHEVLIDRLRTERKSITSGIAIAETVMAVARELSNSVQAADDLVRDLASASAIDVVPIGAAETAAAIAAYARFGKGRGHPARLNLGDCFAYACAKVHDVPLLFVGNDFPQTDVRPALA